LHEAGKLAPAGLEMINIALKNGAWAALDEAEKGTIPPNLQKLFDKNPEAFANWQNFSCSPQRAIRERILNATPPETRAKRRTETAELAAENLKENH